MSIEGAKGILFTVTGGTSMSMYELNEAAKIITGSADPSAKIIFGSVIDESLKDELRITVVATGFGDKRVKKVKLETVTPFTRDEKPSGGTFQRPVVSNPTPKRVFTDDEPAFIRKKMM